MSFKPVEAVEKIVAATGWKPVAPDANGVWHWLLDNDLELNLQSPDGRTLVLFARITDAPSDENGDYVASMERIGRFAAGSIKRRSPILSINEDMLELHRSVSLATATEESLIQETSDFLNAQAWWKRSLTGDASVSPMSGFAMGNFFSDQFQF